MKHKILNNLNNDYILLRHGQTDANKQNIYMGRLDYSLNEKGKRQASDVVIPKKIDIIISSPLKRTRETAIIILSKIPKTQMMTDIRIIEKSGGDIEGKNYKDIAKNHPESWGIWERHSLEFILKSKFPNGESDEEVSNRIKDFFFDIEKKYQNKTILLVIHSGVIQVIRYLLGKSKEEIYLNPVPSCHVETM